MNVLHIAVSHPLAVLVTVVDGAMARTAADNAACALADERARREQWDREGDAIAFPAPRRPA